MRTASTPGYLPTPTHVRVMNRSTYEDRGHTSLCCIFKGALNDGYGQVITGSRIDGTRRIIAAHKAVYEHFNGPVPEGMEIDHLCRQKDCCELTHLEAVTHSENVRRTWPYRVYTPGKRTPRTPRTHCHKGHELTPENTRVKAARAGTRRVCVTCANECNRQYRARRRSLA